MIVCSIDLIDGKAVQLRQGERLVLERDDVRALAERFGRVGEVAVIDVDAARGNGENHALIEELCKIAPCRVGGGIRDAGAALRYLRAGAQRVILGTAASVELLVQLPRERTIVAVDARGDRVASNGWRTLESETPLARSLRLQPFCGGFLYTDIEREGMLAGSALERARALRASLEAPLTVAGGVRSVEEIATLDRMGVDAQVGMALYTGVIDEVSAFVATLDFEKGGGLIPTIVCDVRSGRVRMLGYSSRESVTIALREASGVYWSRTRQHLWRKGETSGATQRLIRAEVDCDRDALVFYVEQTNATCHAGADRCFASPAFGWSDLAQRIDERIASVDAESYTNRLLCDGTLLDEKLMEEIQEVIETRTREELAWEVADLLYFLTVKMRRGGIGIDDVMCQLASRAVAR